MRLIPRSLFAYAAFAATGAATLSLDLAAQAASPPAAKFDRTGVGDTSIFAPLTFGVPNSMRAASGAPGAHYWQNRADYDIRATLDTATKSVTGEMTLHYSNNSPDTLTFIWLQTEQNAFRPSSLNSLIFPQNSRFGGGGFAGGYTISRFEQALPASAVHPVPPLPPIEPVDESAKTKVWSIQGRPHPFSPGEQLLAAHLAQDAELAPLFCFNERVETVCHSRYWVDLLWNAGRLVIDIDGYRIHSKRPIFNQDRQRDYELLLSGYTVLRLPHDEVIADVSAALEKIRKLVRLRGQFQS